MDGSDPTFGAAVVRGYGDNGIGESSVKAVFRRKMALLRH